MHFPEKKTSHGWEKSLFVFNYWEKLGLQVHKLKDLITVALIWLVSNVVLFSLLHIVVIICMALSDFVYLGLTAAAITPSQYVLSQDPYAVGIPIAG